MGCNQSFIKHQLLKNEDDNVTHHDPDFIKEQYQQHQMTRKYLFLGKRKMDTFDDDDDDEKDDDDDDDEKDDDDDDDDDEKDDDDDDDDTCYSDNI